MSRNTFIIQGSFMAMNYFSVILPEQQLGEVVQIVSPYWPCVAARVFTVSVLYSHLIKFCQHDLTVVVCDVFLSSHRYPKRFQVVDGGRIILHVFVMSIG